VNILRYFTALMGMLAALLGIARDSRTLIWVAIGFLGSSVAVRLLQRQQRRRGEEADSGESDRD